MHLCCLFFFPLKPFFILIGLIHKATSLPRRGRVVRKRSFSAVWTLKVRTWLVETIPKHRVIPSMSFLT